MAEIGGGEQIPKPLLTHPKGLTEGANGVLYVGAKRGIKVGTSSKMKEALMDLKKIHQEDPANKAKEELLEVVERTRAILDTVKI